MSHLSRLNIGSAVGMKLRSPADLGRLADACGMLGLMLSAFGLAFSKAAQNVGMLLMLIGVVMLGPSVWVRLWHSALFKLCLGWAAYVLLSAWYFSMISPDLAGEHWDHARQMLRLIYIPITAWWFAANPQRIRVVLLSMLAGTLLAILIYAEWNGLLSAMIGAASPTRSGFGSNEQHFGLFSLLALLGLTVFYSEWLGESKGASRLAKFLVILFIFILILVALVATQTRAVWMALAILFVLGVLIGLPLLVKKRQVGLKSLVWILAPCIIAGAFFYTQWDTVKQRMAPELNIVSSYVFEQKEPDRVSSMYVRFRLWNIAKEGVAASPIIGWGPAGETKLIQESYNEPSYVREYSHVHNSFLGLAVRTGMVGLAFFAAATLMIGKSVKSAWRQGNLDSRLAFYLFSTFFVFLFLNLTESYLDRQVGWFVVALFGGAGYTFVLRCIEGDKDR